jgi:hypothetical protein
MRHGYVSSAAGATCGSLGGGLAGIWLGAAWANAAGMDGLDGLGPVLLGAAVGVWLGSVAGCWVGLRLRGHADAARTAALHIVLLPASVIGFTVAQVTLQPVQWLVPLVGGVAPALVVATPAASAILARRLTDGSTRSTARYTA